ncbi:hypothetical protein ACHAQJ_005826 [Trichoderma viride]
MENTIVIGLFTGALAAAAISCSHNLLDLVPLAVEAIVVAFHTGICIDQFAKRIMACENDDLGWSITVSGRASVEEAVRLFCESTTLPSTSLPYIGTYALDEVMINGPPESLARLVSSEFFQDVKSKNVPIYGLYHAPHLYSQQNVAEILEAAMNKESAIVPSGRIQLFSACGTGVRAGTFADLLTDAVGHILVQQITWINILDKLQSFIVGESFEELRVIPVATNADQLVYHGLGHVKTLRVLNSVQPTLPYQSVSPGPKMAKLAIVGMSGRFPSANSSEALWDLLYQGLDVHKPTPPLRWDIGTHVDPTGTRRNTSRTPFGCWLDDPAVFDAGFFNIFPKKVPQIDPAQRLALMTTYEAMEQAGIVPDATPSTRRDRIGVFYGVTSNDWMDTNSAQDIDAYYIPGGSRAFIPGRINYFFKLTGPSFAIDTACSSSMAGIHMACNSLWCGDVDTAIAGGTNVLTRPDITAGLDRGNFLSHTGNCKTFDDGADGYCRGEGVSTVIIKRLDDALMDKDPILGVILSASTNHSAESESITRPHVGAQSTLFNKILRQGDAEPYSVSYVEMHGTGTQTGDVCEMSSVLDTFAPRPAKKSRNSEQPLYLGSIKANIGHGEAVAGASSLIKVLLMMKKNTIVPHCGIKTELNRKFPTDLEDRNVHIARAPIAWQRSADPRRAIVNSFSAAGGNSTLLIEDAPKDAWLENDNSDRSRPHIIAFSAKNGVSLQGNLRSLLGFLQANSDVPLGQLSYTTTARRVHHQHRTMIYGSTVQEVSSKIEVVLQGNADIAPPKSSLKIVFTFTGQGTQYPGMGKEFYRYFSIFRDEVRRLDQLGQNQGFPSFLPVIESQERDISVFEPIIVHLASVCIQIALTRLWAAWNIVPVAVVGHSLGEYAALNAAGVISDADTIYLVGKRAELLQQKCSRDTHAMLLVKGSVDEVAAALGANKYEVSCINSPIGTVIAESRENLAVLQELLTAATLKSTLLKVPYAFHSSQIDPILDDFKRIASGVTFSDPIIPILCPLTGSVIVASNGKFDPEYLANHFRRPVNMLKALLTAQNEGIITSQTIVLEIGPHPSISNMIRDTFGTGMILLASSHRTQSIWQVLGATLTALYTAGADIRWAEYQRDFSTNHKVISLPAYSWNLKEYWIQYMNDWSLYKGDPLLIPCIPCIPLNLKSTTIHKIVEESGNGTKSNIIVEADIARSDLNPLVKGYEVDSIYLCPPSIYTEIALSLATYLLKKYQPTRGDDLIDVSDMAIYKALSYRKDALEQLLQAQAEVDWTSNRMLAKFTSFNEEGKRQEYCSCCIRFGEGGLQKRLQDEAASTQQKMKHLQDGISTGISVRYNHSMLYRAILTMNRIDDHYRGINEFILNSHTHESFSRLSFHRIKHEGSFHTHPAIIDSIAQTCGFTLNCNDATDLEKEVFMFHGWKSFQMFEPMALEKVYTAYTHLVEGDNKLFKGDVIIFDGDRVVAFIDQISYQGTPRRVLRAIVRHENEGKSKMQTLPQPKHTVIANLPSTAKLLSTASLVVPLAVPTSSDDSDDPRLAKALAIISEESGLPMEGLTDDTAFSEMGLDSLFSLNIFARFKEEIGIEFNFNSLFFEYPSIGDLKIFFLGLKPSNAGVSASGSSSARSNTPPSDIDRSN